MRKRTRPFSHLELKVVNMSIAQIVQENPPQGEALPVIFNGFRPRHLGYAISLQAADKLALIHSVSATYVSRAQTKHGQCFILHG